MEAHHCDCVGVQNLAKKKRKEKIGQQFDTYTGKNLDVDRVWFAAGCRASVVASVGFVSVDNLQFAVRPSTVFRLDEDTFTLRLVVKQLVVVVPEDELRWDWTLQWMQRRGGEYVQKEKIQIIKERFALNVAYTLR